MERVETDSRINESPELKFYQELFSSDPITRISARAVDAVNMAIRLGGLHDYN
jgi:hypothetical protein